MNAVDLHRDPKLHELKIHPEHFANVKAGRKTAELRLDDRDFRIGDVLLLKEWKTRAQEFSGREIRKPITHITRCRMWIPGVEEDWCVLHMGVDK